MKSLIKLTFVLNMVFLFACSPLQSRIEEGVNNIDYSDGIDKEEANLIAEHFRINNLSWVDLVGPSDGGDYWIYTLTQGQSGETLESPPVYILKNAWSYQSAIRFDKDGY